MSDLAKTITKNIKQILDDQNMLATELAERAELPKSTVYRSIENEQVPSLPSLVAMAKALGVTLDRIVFGKEAGHVGTESKGKTKNQDRRSDRNRSRQSRR